MCQASRYEDLEHFKVPCLRREDKASSDDILLKKSVQIANYAYSSFRAKGMQHVDICQVDIHADSSDKHKAEGASCLYISQPGYILGTLVYRGLEIITPWKDRGITKRPDLWTLKESSAVNIVIECSFYDEKKQRIWLIDNKIIVAQTILKAVRTYLGLK